MKRTGFKKKLTVPLKRSGFKRKPYIKLEKEVIVKKKRKQKSEIRKVQDELWQECRRITKAKYIKNNCAFFCFTCDKIIEGSNCQLGHFIPNSVSGALLRYNLNNLRLQCYHCNINLGGNGSEFYRRLVLENGQEYVDNLFKLKEKTVKALDHYKELLEKYRQIE